MFKSLSRLESDIITCLAQAYPLSPKEILQKVDRKRVYSLAGVHKALAQLLKKSFLHKHGKYYQLSTNELIDQKNQIQTVLDRYLGAQSYHTFLKKESTYFFENLSELDLFWNAVVEKWFRFYPKNKHNYWQKQGFPWFTILHMDEETRVVRKISEHAKDFRTFCVDQVITRQLDKVYRVQKNCHYHLVRGMSDLGHAFAVYGDHVIETFHPPSTIKVLEELANSKSDSILFPCLLELAKPGTYALTVSKDKKKAEEYRSRMEKWIKVPPSFSQALQVD